MASTRLVHTPEWPNLSEVTLFADEESLLSHPVCVLLDEKDVTVVRPAATKLPRFVNILPPDTKLCHFSRAAY